MTAVDELRLTEWTSCGGCAAKWGGAPLAGAGAGPGRRRPTRRCSSGLAPFDDAAVYRLSDDARPGLDHRLLPAPGRRPVRLRRHRRRQRLQRRVRHGRTGGAGPQHLRLPRAHAGGGGRPPSSAAAAEVVAEAGGSVAGGHTIRSEEPIFGLAVQGLVHPDRVWTKAGARPGDVLLLSKPIGTGIVLAGGGDDDKAAAIAVMRRLNRAAAEALSGCRRRPPHAVTDVTGFGLLGHAWEMAERSGARLVIDTSARCRCTPAPWPRPRPACAPAATPATGPTWRAGWRRRRRPAMEALPTTPRRRAACWPRSTPAATPGPRRAGFRSSARVEAGPAGVELSLRA